MKKGLFIAALALGGCASEPPPEELTYQCANEFEVGVVRFGDQEVQAEIDNERFLLSRVPAASGEKYQSADQSLQLWFKGAQMSMKWKSYPIQICTQPQPYQNLEPLSSE